MVQSILPGDLVQLPASTSDSSQLPVIPVPGDPIPSGLLGYVPIRGTYKFT